MQFLLFRCSTSKKQMLYVRFSITLLFLHPLSHTLGASLVAFNPLILIQHTSFAFSCCERKRMIYIRTKEHQQKSFWLNAFICNHVPFDETKQQERALFVYIMITQWTRSKHSSCFFIHMFFTSHVHVEQAKIRRKGYGTWTLCWLGTIPPSHVPFFDQFCTSVMLDDYDTALDTSQIPLFSSYTRSHTPGVSHVACHPLLKHFSSNSQNANAEILARYLHFSQVTLQAMVCPSCVRRHQRHRWCCLCHLPLIVYTRMLASCGERVTTVTQCPSAGE